MSLVTIRIGGVPEHFNLPIHLGVENGSFEKAGINIEWIHFPEGTGHMTKALREDSVDVCIPLTEGIITDIINGNPSKIISEYVITPLTWGIHTGNDSELQPKDNFFPKRHAISRFGSGSHLMAIVNANSHGITLLENQFTVINNLDGAIESLNRLETDVFYWEKYTTKPYVDAGTIRKISEHITPWPCFVVAATDNVLTRYRQAIAKMLDIIQENCRHFMKDTSAIAMTSERYNQRPIDIERWYHKTEWAANSWVSDKMITDVIYHLKSAGILPKEKEIPEIIWKE